MCIYSAVMDHYGPRIPDLGKQWEDYWRKLLPDMSQTNPNFPTQQDPLGPMPMIDLSALKKLADEIRQTVREFKEAVEAAKKLDVLLKQPDCVDPEKEKLVARVKELEDRLEQAARIVNLDGKKEAPAGERAPTTPAR